jgi:protein phosphatase
MDREGTDTENGPFDIVGDVHGCLDELVALLAELGYSVAPDTTGYHFVPPAGRRVVFLGDLVNRGPDSAGTLRLTMTMVESGHALCLKGNHDVYLLRKLQGADILSEFNMTNESAVLESIAQLDSAGAAFRARALAFLESLPWRLELDGGRLVLAHAGLPLQYHHSESPAAQAFAVHGPPPSRSSDSPPTRWHDAYDGEALVVHGHYAGTDVRWANNTVCLDTGCVYGGRLTALRYPEREFVSVPARRIYFYGRISPQFQHRA